LDGSKIGIRATRGTAFMNRPHLDTMRIVHEPVEDAIHQHGIADLPKVTSLRFRRRTRRRIAEQRLRTAIQRRVAIAAPLLR
jgi:hypothetical protein